MKLPVKLILTIILVLFIVIAFQNVSATVSTVCGGKHNIQIDGDTLPSISITPAFNTKVFVLPEVSGFQELYRDFLKFLE